MGIRGKVFSAFQKRRLLHRNARVDIIGGVNRDPVGFITQLVNSESKRFEIWNLVSTRKVRWIIFPNFFLIWTTLARGICAFIYSSPVPTASPSRNFQLDRITCFDLRDLRIWLRSNLITGMQLTEMIHLSSCVITGSMQCYESGESERK